MNPRSFLTWSLAAGAVALLAIRTAPAAAETPSTAAYHSSSHPMISGTVVTVNDHRMVVNTDQGEAVTLDLDSRTMTPRDLAPGMVMRVDFVAQEDCHFYAQRVTAIRSGTTLSRPQAYANTRDSREATEQDASAAGSYNRETGVGAVSRHVPGVTLSATHNTADYLFSTRPMLSGRVVAVNDHQMILDTDQGQMVGLLMDSRTMVPGDVAPGTIVRAEFKSFEDGRHYATRVQSISTSAVDREQAYAHTLDRDVALVQRELNCGASAVAAPPAPTSSTIAPIEVPATPPVVAAQTEPEPAVGSSEMLPQTASNQPLILLLGLLALAGGVVMAIARRYGVA